MQIYPHTLNFFKLSWIFLENPTWHFLGENPTWLKSNFHMVPWISGDAAKPEFCGCLIIILLLFNLDITCDVKLFFAFSDSPFDTIWIFWISLGNHVFFVHIPTSSNIFCRVLVCRWLSNGPIQKRKGRLGKHKKLSYSYLICPMQVQCSSLRYLEVYRWDICLNTINLAIRCLLLFF